MQKTSAAGVAAEISDLSYYVEIKLHNDADG